MQELENNSRYHKTSFYVIKCKNQDVKDCYVGHTVNGLSKRLINHKSACKTFPNRKLYKFINENGGFDNFTFELLEECCLNNQLEAIEKEQFYCNKEGASLNTFKPSANIVKRSYRQNWYAKHKERHLKKMKRLHELRKTFNEFMSIEL